MLISQSLAFCTSLIHSSHHIIESSGAFMSAFSPASIFLGSLLPFPAWTTWEIVTHALPSLSVSLHMLAATPALCGPAVEPPLLGHYGIRTLPQHPADCPHSSGTSSPAVPSAVFPFSLLSFTPLPPQWLFCLILKAPLTGPDSTPPSPELPLRKTDHIGLDLL